MEERRLKRGDSNASNESFDLDIEELLSKSKYEILKEVEGKLKKVIEDYSKSNNLIRSELIGFKNEMTNEINASKLWLSELEASKDSTDNAIRTVKAKMTAIETQSLRLKTEIDMKSNITEVDALRKHVDIMTPLLMHEDLKHQLENFMLYKEVIDGHTVQVDSLDRSVSIIFSKFEEVNKNIDALRNEIMTKASAEALRNLGVKVEQSATKKALDEVKADVNKCATKKELENALQKISEVRQELQNYVRIEMMDGIRKEIIDSIHRDMRSYVRDDIFKMAIDSLKDNLNQLTNRVKERENTVDRVLIEHRRDINTLTFQMNDEPWMIGINECKDLIDTKADINDFDIHKDAVQKMLDEFDARLREFRENVNEFALVMERFDEVILDKASKQDVQAISMQLPSFAIKVLVEPALKEHKEKLDDLDARTLETISNVATLLKRSKNWQSTETQSKVMKKEFARLTDQIEDVRISLKEKSDRADFLTLLDTVSKREELNSLRESMEAYHKQLETAAVLTIALTKSTLKSNESYSSKEKQRFDIYKHLSSLLRWISSSEIFDVEQLISSSRRILQGAIKKANPELNPLSLSSPNPSDSIQSPYRTMSPARTTTKGKRLMGQHLGFTDDGRTSVDLPPIRQ
jgi:hypothetical protein